MKLYPTVVLAILCSFAAFSPAQAQAQDADLASLQQRAEAGEVKAQVELGFRYLRGIGVQRDYAQALTLYRGAAAQGDTTAENQLGFMYQHGWGVPRDYAQALLWFRKSAEQGNASGQNNLGLMYQDGQGVPQDYAQALAWYHRAADQGLGFAQSNLGNMYHDGQGVPQNYAQALAWFRMAAEQGVADAQFNLAFMYQHGQGVPQDYAQARNWYQKAADQGVTDAKTQLAALDNLQQVERDQQKQARLNAIAGAIQSVGQSFQNAAGQRTAANASIAQQNQRQQAAQPRLGTAQAAQKPTAGAQIPMSGSPSPLMVVFRGTHPPYQGHARVISDPPGIDCPGVCSFQFHAQTVQTVLLNGYADKNSAILGFYPCTGGGSTEPISAGNYKACNVTQFGDGGSTIFVDVDPYPAPR